MKITADQLLFSVKLFIAAILAFMVAVRIGLPQPYWSLVTCCVVMNPNTGAIRSKATYRFADTFCAGIVSLGLVSLFASVPILLIVSAGLVATLAFGASLLDRTPRSYGFMLFAVTLMLVAVAGVDHPETMFDTVVARVTEIGLGIIAATLVDSVIVPGSLAGSLRSNLERWLPDMERWARDVLDLHESGAAEEHDRLKTLSDITALSQKTALLRYDPTVDRGELRHALAIQQRLLQMVPLLSAISGRIAGLNEAERSALAAHLADARDCLAKGALPPPDFADAVRSLPLSGGLEQPWQQLVHDALADALVELLTTWSEIHRIAATLEDRSGLDSDLAGQVRDPSAFPLAPDFDQAIYKRRSKNVPLTGLLGSVHFGVKVYR
ncbi:FUSC family protein, partial [Rhizorhapis sp. SPR117]|uniref:FUSC family protein n=1 Tax=Rhizorhapis sp. SPR117 TaxID=2912611 RepID=UPI001F2C0A81|nr:FUSC family protein [Rhizorhapis sp. SPR117]